VTSRALVLRAMLSPAVSTFIHVAVAPQPAVVAARHLNFSGYSESLVLG
jgi:hypothetical protein